MGYLAATPALFARARNANTPAFLSKPARACRLCCGVLSFAFASLYVWCPVHRFPSPAPFHGSAWYDPYGGVTAATRWRKVNLHAHSRAWLGLTNGRGSAADVFRRYRELGYDVAAISNYQQIARATPLDSSALTVYEQGFNISKVHFLALAPRRVDWLDYPFLQGRDGEQHRIDRLRESAGVVILAHPGLRHAPTDADLRALTGYTAMEIGSDHSHGMREWNVALDAGRPVWGVADDDAHDVQKPNEIGRFWTSIASDGLDAASMQRAITAGRMYAVFGVHGRVDLTLRSFVLRGDTLAVAFAGPAADLELVGPGGRVLAAVPAADSARWVIPCDVAWVRVVARTRTAKVYLEPLLRSETGLLPRIAASIAPVPTFIRRALALALAIASLARSARSILRRSGNDSSAGDAPSEATDQTPHATAA